MRHRHFAWLVVLCAAWTAAGIKGSGQTSAVERAVMQSIDQANVAFQRRDVKAYSLTTTDFVRVDSNGRASGRSDWLRNVGAAGPDAVRRVRSVNVASTATARS
jgi:hypothetical protein